MKEIAITIKDLNKVYKLYNNPMDRLKEGLNIRNKCYHKEYYALKNINLKVEKGEILGIVGSNGSGKSTLLKIITGVLNPNSGEVNIKGTISALLELGTGFNPEYTGIQNIYLYGTMLGKDKKEVEKEIPSILEFADIGDFIHQPVKTYSSGMFARLAFSVAININPEILIVDEILSVGDLRFQIKCMQKMKDMMSKGTTVLFVSHDINSIKRFCTKVLWLNKGIIEEYGDVDEVTDAYLDFLKMEETKKDSNKNKEEDPGIHAFQNKESIAEIKAFKVLDRQGDTLDSVQNDAYTQIKVIYDVYDDTLKNPVLGIAIRTIDDDYVCGLNTLIDQIEVPWKYGRNEFTLEYPRGILAIGGKYYFDVALFEETATVPIQYISKIKEITIKSRYSGEGRYIIPHRWRE